MNLPPVPLQNIQADWLTDKNISLDVLRLDKIHPVVSGNKWFKLKYYIADAIATKKNMIATFGGAWSNHIVATAFACWEAGISCAGIIRGEEPQNLSDTLLFARQLGMQLHFISRKDYSNKELAAAQFETNNWYWIAEGGYGTLGARGASEILKTTDSSKYTHFIAAVGTGTMLAGLLLSSRADQEVLGISSMKGNCELRNNILQLAGEIENPERLTIYHEYHFGGYGKHPVELIEFINGIYHQHQLPLDIIYTGKTFFATKDLVEKGFFEPSSKLLLIHSGGLQGNKSLAPEVLAF